MQHLSKRCLGRTRQFRALLCDRQLRVGHYLPPAILLLKYVRLRCDSVTSVPFCMPLVVPRCVITTTSELGMSNLYSSAVYVAVVTSVLAALLEAINCCLSCASPLGPMASALSPIILSSLAASPPASAHSLSSAIKAFGSNRKRKIHMDDLGVNRELRTVCENWCTTMRGTWNQMMI